MNKKEILAIAIIVALLPLVEIASADDSSPPSVVDKGSHFKANPPGQGKWCKLIEVKDGESGVGGPVGGITINVSAANNVDGNAVYM